MKKKLIKNYLFILEPHRRYSSMGTGRMIGTIYSKHMVSYTFFLEYSRERQNLTQREISYKAARAILIFWSST